MARILSLLPPQHISPVSETTESTDSTDSTGTPATSFQKLASFTPSRDSSLRQAQAELVRELISIKERELCLLQHLRRMHDPAGLRQLQKLRQAFAQLERKLEAPQQKL